MRAVKEERGKRKEERGKRKEERGKRKEERGKREEVRGKVKGRASKRDHNRLKFFPGFWTRSNSLLNQDMASI
ncbi:MAG: hypothetical protein V2B19_17275 [Pseudomonadota bacterium]